MHAASRRATRHDGRRVRRGAPLAFGLLLVLALIPALATSGLALPLRADTPLGSLSVTVTSDGTPLAVGFDQGSSPLPGDDTLRLREAVSEAQVTWRGDAAVPVSAEAGLRGLTLHHTLLSTAGHEAANLGAARPDVLQGAPWPYIGPDGIDETHDLPVHEAAAHRQQGDAGWPIPYPDSWDGQRFGANYDAVYLPAAFEDSSDRSSARTTGDATYACAAFAGAAGAEPGLCADPAPLLASVTPDIQFLTELQQLGLSAAPRSDDPGHGAPLAPMSLHVGATAVGIEALASPGEALLSVPRAEAQLPRGGASPAEAPEVAPLEVQSAVDLSVLPVELGPALPFVLAAAAALLLPFLVLYRRLLPSEALGHPLREQMLQQVRAQPGIHESELARAMGLRHTHVQYHLRVLEEARILEARKFGGLKCLFEVGRLSEAQKGAALAEHGRGTEVVARIAAEPGIAQRALARQLGMSESSVKWHLDRLAGSGLVRIDKLRGAKRVWAMPGMVAAATPAAAAQPLLALASVAPQPPSA